MRVPTWNRWIRAALLALAAAALTGCLGPDEPDPTGNAPIGHLDGVIPVQGGFRAVGWVADPNTTAPIEVTVSSEQRTVVGLADRDRPDIGAALPHLGPWHGFDVLFTGLSPGPHQVCVWAENVGPGDRARALGCTTVTVPSLDPFGAIDAIVPTPGALRVDGWAIDPETSAAIEVGVLLDGAPALVERADLDRPDLGQRYGLGDAHGFSFPFPATTGPHQVCAIASNVGAGAATWLGCQVVDVPAPPPDRRPAGSVTAVTPTAGSGVRVQGTAADPDTTGPLTVRIEVDGTPHDVSTVGGAYDTTIGGLGAGSHQVCVTALDAPSAGGGAVLTGDRTWPCGTAILGAVSVGSSGAPAGPPTPVGPAAGHPLAGIDRDAGVSVPLRDGSVLWLFGDSSQVDRSGSLRYFVNNTAAWAPADSPNVTQDAAPGGAPVRFVSPVGTPWSCPADRPTRAMWPLSAVRTDGTGQRDVVTAFFGNVCLGDEPLEIEPRGVALVRWTYDPADPPAGEPITGTVVTQHLFPVGHEHGTAATTDGTFVYGYDCESPPDGPGVEWPDRFGPCTVGRVPVAAAGTRSAWTYWNGAAWTSNETSAAPVIAGSSGGEDPRAPVASLTVSWDEVHGVYVMAYSPWPGFTDRISVRVAPAPQGPWSDVVEVALPGCEDAVGRDGFLCYAGTVQPQLSRPGLLGLGYYDQLVAVAPNRGQYLTVGVPFTVVR
ncbi:DUF4185 domain-containing protein [Dermatobacter hominis]|uniref:DUF4185 domain-containing protein n=1 Tax=Dermatobacter hominis TaxID=2884263 RepID=UPI001D1279FA|nr:DUF4185 domain-containing protein [Dermatobacter hominis]UDY34094.1 DUF4185 domain-containing protein [Dermatobacter hominis]